MTVFDQLQTLVDSFRRDVQIARELESPNADDDLTIKTAIVGFSYHSPTDQWEHGHLDFVRVRIDRGYSASQLVEYGENGFNVGLFFALCIGYLLGLFQQDRISEQDFRVAEDQLPGLIMLHLGTLTEQPV